MKNYTYPSRGGLPNRLLGTRSGPRYNTFGTHAKSSALLSLTNILAYGAIFSRSVYVPFVAVRSARGQADGGAIVCGEFIMERCDAQKVLDAAEDVPSDRW